MSAEVCEFDAVLKRCDGTEVLTVAFIPFDFLLKARRNPSERRREEKRFDVKSVADGVRELVTDLQ